MCLILLECVCFVGGFAWICGFLAICGWFSGFAVCDFLVTYSGFVGFLDSWFSGFGFGFALRICRRWFALMVLVFSV